MKPTWVLTNEERQERLLKRQSSKKSVFVGSLHHLVPAFDMMELHLAEKLDRIFTDTVYRNYFSIFNDDLQTFVTFIRHSCEGNIFPFELIQKLEKADNKILQEHGCILFRYKIDLLNNQFKVCLAKLRSLKGDCLWSFL